MTVKLSLSPSNASNIAAPTSEAVSSESQDNSGANNARKRPKSVSQWTVADVQKWLRKNCGDVFHLYSIKFLEQDITGRSLVRLTDNSLLRLEIVIPEHRQAILREIAKLRLRGSILLLKDREMKLRQLQQSSAEVC